MMVWFEFYTKHGRPEKIIHIRSMYVESIEAAIEEMLDYSKSYFRRCKHANVCYWRLRGNGAHISAIKHFMRDHGFIVAKRNQHVTIKIRREDVYNTQMPQM